MTSKRLLRIPVNHFPFTPSTYPGRRPRFSFLLTRGGIYRTKLRDLDRILESRGLAQVSERYAILAYGSNACPGHLLDKKLTDVPVLYGRVMGAEAVYAKRKTQRGYVPATLARKQGSRSSWVTLLTTEQLEKMDTSEGRPYAYALAEIPSVKFFIGRSQLTPLYSYVDICGGVMTISGKPLSLGSTSQKRAKSMQAQSLAEDATEWLDFDVIAHPSPPTTHAQIVRTHR